MTPLECPISQLGVNIMIWSIIGLGVMATCLLGAIANQTKKAQVAQAYAAQWQSLQDGTLGSALLAMLVQQQVTYVGWQYGQFKISTGDLSATGHPTVAVAEMAAMLEARKIARRLSGDHN